MPNQPNGYAVRISAQTGRRANKRQKLYTAVKKLPFSRQKTAKTLQRCTEKVVYALKSDRNFTAVYRKGRLHAKSGKNFTRATKKAAGTILPPNFHYALTHKTALRAKQQKVRTT